jgi:NAD(P)-dependent dehydrogenase (short-subunit alcohol dehydrogenase family)
MVEINRDMFENNIVVITGATNGIGQIAAIELAKLGVKLALTSRSKSRAEATEKYIKEVAPNTKIDFYYGDLSLMSDVQRIGHEINAAYPKIDVLINNAGLHGFEQRITSEGFAEMIAVNYFAPWLLTNLLRESLVRTGNARIVNVASEASRNHGLLKLPDDLTDTSPFTLKRSSEIYGKTKLLNIMFNYESARNLNGTGVTVNALNPGFNNTGLGRELRISHILGKILKFLHIGDPQNGADIIVRLASDVCFQGITGGYFNVKTGSLIEPIYPGNDIATQERLWSDTKRILQKYL